MISTSENQDSNPQTLKKALVVLGMHRSGTSALTRVLSLCGASLPNRLIPPKANDNEAGFWEPSQIGKIHDELLVSSGSSWHDFSEFPSSWYASSAAIEFKKRILGVLGEDFADSSLFVLKDPRICRLVPFWLDILQEFGAEPNFIIPIRHPLEIAASLKKRDGFGLAKSLLLWLQHFLASERDTRNMSRSFSSYDKLLIDWQGVISRIETDLQISFPRRSHLASAEIDEFLRFDLRHHHEKLDDLSVRSDIVNWVRVAFNWAIRASNGDGVSSDELDAIYSAFLEADKAYGPIIAQANLEASKYQSQLSQLDEFSENLNKQKQLLEAKEKLVADLGTKLETQQQTIAELNSGLKDKEQIVTQLNTELETKEQLAADLGTKLETQQQTIAELNSGLEDKKQVVTQLNTELETKEQLIANLGTKLKTQEQTVIELITELGNREREIAYLETKLKTQEQDIIHLSAGLRARQQVISNLETNLKTQHEETLRWTEAFQSQEQKIITLKTNVTTQEQEINDLKQQLEIGESRIIQFESGIVKRDRRLENLELEASRLKGQVEIETKTRRQEVTHLETKLKNKEQEVTQLTTKLQNRNQEVINFNKNLQSRDEKITKFESGLLKRDRRIENLEMETSRLKGEIGQIQASPSWKMIVQVKSLGGNILKVPRMVYWAATLQLPRKLREEKAYHLIAQSGFFDTGYYLLTYPGVAEKGLDPIRHFMNYYHEGRNPSANFDTKFYLRYNPDVAGANMNPLVHYIRYGQSEQRATKP